MTHLEWHFITENQNLKEKAEKTGQLLVKTINLNTVSFNISKYEKFEDGYSIKLTTEIGEINNESELLLMLLKVTSSICMPWTIYFKEPIELVQLVFSKQNGTNYSNQSFNVIKWGHVQFVN